MKIIRFIDISISDHRVELKSQVKNKKTVDLMVKGSVGHWNIGLPSQGGSEKLL